MADALRLSLLLLLVLGFLACGGAVDVTSAKNTDRLFYTREMPDHSLRSCAEFPGPAAMEQQFNVFLEFLKAHGGFEHSEHLARIYDVNEVMQFGHTMLQQYCGMYLDGSLSPEEYRVVVGDVSTRLVTLMVVAQQGVNPAAALAQLTQASSDRQTLELRLEKAAADERATAKQLDGVNSSIQTAYWQCRERATNAAKPEGPFAKFDDEKQAAGFAACEATMKALVTSRPTNENWAVPREVGALRDAAHTLDLTI